MKRHYLVLYKWELCPVLSSIAMLSISMAATFPCMNISGAQLAKQSGSYCALLESIFACVVYCWVHDDYIKFMHIAHWAETHLQCAPDVCFQWLSEILFTLFVSMKMVASSAAPPGYNGCGGFRTLWDREDVVVVLKSFQPITCVKRCDTMQYRCSAPAFSWKNAGFNMGKDEELAASM